MRIASVVPLAAAAFAAFGVAGGSAFADADRKVSGRHVRENLVIYFIHGNSADGPVPLTLSEALAKGRVQVIETGRVNELQIENTGDEEVFVQVGDIVKGGKQDRVLTVGLVLPPKSGMIPIASFCVEQGRGRARRRRGSRQVHGATDFFRRARRLRHGGAAQCRAARNAACWRPGPARGRCGEQQQRMWESVCPRMQTDLSAGVMTASSLAAIGDQPAAVARECQAQGGSGRLRRRP